MLRVDLGAMFDAQEVGGPAGVQGGLPGGGKELQRMVCGVRSRSRGGAKGGQGACVNLSSESDKILQLRISVSFILTFT